MKPERLPLYNDRESLKRLLNLLRRLEFGTVDLCPVCREMRHTVFCGCAAEIAHLEDVLTKIEVE